MLHNDLARRHTMASTYQQKWQGDLDKLSQNIQRHGAPVPPPEQRGASGLPDSPRRRMKLPAFARELDTIDNRVRALVEAEEEEQPTWLQIARERGGVAPIKSATGLWGQSPPPKKYASKGGALLPDIHTSPRQKTKKHSARKAAQMAELRRWEAELERREAAIERREQGRALGGMAGGEDSSETTGGADDGMEKHTGGGALPLLPDIHSSPQRPYIGRRLVMEEEEEAAPSYKSPPPSELMSAIASVQQSMSGLQHYFRYVDEKLRREENGEATVSLRCPLTEAGGGQLIDVSDEAPVDALLARAEATVRSSRVARDDSHQQQLSPRRGGNKSTTAATAASKGQRRQKYEAETARLPPSMRSRPPAPIFDEPRMVTLTRRDLIEGFGLRIIESPAGLSTGAAAAGHAAGHAAGGPPIVAEVRSGSLAYKSGGLRGGELVLSINGQSTSRGASYNLEHLMAPVSGSTNLSLLVAPPNYVPDPVKEIKRAMGRKLQRIIDLLRTMDRNGDGQVQRHEFVNMLPLVVETHHTPDDYRAAFDALDGDKSGAIDYNELSKGLRRDDIQLAAELQVGAMGEIETESKNRLSVRKSAREGSMAPEKELMSAEELKKCLVRESTRVVDCFRIMDRDGNGLVSRKEFRAALPLLGYAASNRPVLDTIFAEMDVDGSGEVDYNEMNRALRRDDIQLAAELQVGAMGEIETESKNVHALRNDAMDEVSWK